jgi:hypothetical protein
MTMQLGMERFLAVVGLLQLQPVFIGLAHQ